METAKKKITVRFVVEQDFEIEVKDSNLAWAASLLSGMSWYPVALTNGMS